MTRTWVNWKPFLAHFIPYPDARLPLKRQTLIPEPMSYRLLYHHESTKPVIPAPDNRPGNQHRQQHGEQGHGKQSQQFHFHLQPDQSRPILTPLFSA